MLEEGDQIRDYTLRRFLGQGSYGEVWLAERKIELADDCIPFALKFLTHEDSGNAESLKNEVRTWIKAGNQFNIVPVYDGFIHGRFLVIVSEYVDGGSLRDWLVANNKRAPSLGKAVEMMRGILRGLTHLHSRRIIHRDLKPENILLKDETPKITDFGVSRIVETFSPSAVLRHTKGAGAPLYMPPEAFSDGKPAPQLDTWSAGVMFYEMLTGEFPFNGETLPVLLAEIIGTEPKSLPSGLPEELQKFVSISLAKDVSGRFQTSEQMCDALDTAWAEMNDRKKWNLNTVGNEVPLEGNWQRTSDNPQNQRDKGQEKLEEGEMIQGEVGGAHDRLEFEAKRSYVERLEEESREKPVMDKGKPRWKGFHKSTWVGISALVLAAIIGVIWWSTKQENAEALFSRGKQCYEENDYDCAIANYTKALALNSQSAEVLYSRGRAYNRKGDYDQGIKDLSKAIELNPQYSDAYTYRGAAYGAKGNPDEAIKDLNRAIELNPQFPDAYFNRGIAYRDKGNPDQAIKDLDKALELNPQYAAAYYERGLIHNTDGNRDQAIKDFDKAIEFNSQSAVAHYERGLTYTLGGDRDQAIKDFDKAIELNPQFADAYSDRGAAYLFEGNLDQAIKDLDKAIELNPKLAAAFYCRGLAYGNRGNHDQAMRDFTVAIELNPKMAEAYAYRGSSYSNKRQFDQAMRDFNKAIELNPQLEDAYYNRGITYGTTGHAKEATEDFTKAIQLNPKDARPYYSRAIAYQNLGQGAKAKADALKYKELSIK